MSTKGDKRTEMADDTPLYNLKAVSNEVGLSPATLRAWERRYGMLKPKRTPGGHRLYSRQDIEMLKWLVERQNEGLSISRAVEMWNMGVESRQPMTRQVATPVPVSGMGESMLDELREKWLSACLAFNGQAANLVLDQAFALATPETICYEVLQKGLVQVGEGWYRGSISAQQEHFTSAIAIRRLHALMTATTPPTRSGQILAACPPGEEHDFILLLVSYLLRRHGWDVVYLGANVPMIDLDDTLHYTSPMLVIASAQTLNAAASLRRMSEYLASIQVPLAYGGGIFARIPEAVQSISGHYLGGVLAQVPLMIEHLVTARPALPKGQPITIEYRRALAAFRQNEALISNAVAEPLRVGGLASTYAQIALENFTRLVVSALSLGEIKYLDHSIAWLNGLLENHGLPGSLARQFYGVYLEAVERLLGEGGSMITQWLREQAAPAFDPGQPGEE
jgi:MerR family transcriptional regulator, light-induced transcriptional regulator